MDERDSVFSHEERAIAAIRREDPDASVEAIAEERDADPVAVEKAIDRIREKSHRAVATLVQTPFLEESLADLDAEERERIREAIESGE